MSGRPRLELKYRLDPFAYRAVLATVRGRMRLDRFAVAAGGRYRVRSLYFDTADLSAYVDKLAGVAVRVKPRLRAYADTLAETPFVSVELKGRVASAIVKLATRVDASAYRGYVRTGHFEGADSDRVLAGFERAIRRGAMRPTALVVYEREAYEPRGARLGDLGALRITFDHRVRTAHVRELFAPTRFKDAVAHSVVLEIKTPRELPVWLARAVRDHGLVSLPNSKYTQAVEQAYPGLSW